ncbi:PAS domain S-box protein [Scytonema millei]|uniref:Circadian input-output histidine kinase CikA n=1 Tax=Scytonema millei VB511283 TaxID=1245923 RepID=A0A9X5E7L3_9CYAN|nr:PAS domain S-box protein [Scytonema millei]NHC36791.1 PAS domain S-box protein [Scytonema millei VB511283]
MASTARSSSLPRSETGIFVRQLRHLLELTQTEFAARLGVALPTIARWENNKSQLSPLALMQLKAMLHELKNSPQKVQRICASALLAEYFDEAPQQHSELKSDRAMQDEESPISGEAACQQIESALQVSEQRFRRLADSMPHIVFAARPDGSITYANRFAQEYTGLNDELLERGWTTCIHPDDRDRAFHTWMQAVQSGESYEMECRFRKADGTYRWLLSRGLPIRDNQERIVEWVGGSTDIHELRLAQSALHLSEERFQLMSQATNDVMWDFNVQTQQMWWSERMQLLFGYCPEDLGADMSGWAQRVHPDDLERVEASYATCLSGEALLWSEEYRFRRTNGSYAFVLDRARILRDSMGNPVRVVGAMADISDRKRSELMLTEQKRLLELIASGQPMEECLSSLCESVAKLNPRTRACFLLTDAQRLTFPRSIAPDFPPSFGQGLKDAPINDLCIGTCGEAVYRGQPIACADIANDNRWSPEWRDLCVAHGILACYSTPVLGADNLPLGSLMLCFDRSRMPTDWEYQLAEFGTQVASIAFERDRASLALRQNEARFRAVATNLPNGAVFIVDRDLRYLLAEGKALEDAGMTSGDLVGKTLWEALDPTLVARYEPYYRQALGGEPFSLEHCSHGRYYISHGTPLYDERGEVNAVLAISYDITARKEAETALSQSESRFRLMVESAKDYAIFTLDLNGNVTSWNWGAERLLGYSEAEILGCSGRIIFTPEDNERGKAEQEMQIALTQGQAENERWHVRKDGSRFWGSGLVMPLRDEADNVQGLVKIMQDKTAQRQADERFRLLYDTTSDLLATERPLALMHNLFSKLSAQLELDYFYNYMVEEKDNRAMLHLRNYGGISDEAAEAIEWIEFGQYLCGLVAQERRQIVLDRAQISTHPNAQLICSNGVTAYAGQPLIVQGRLLGTLSFASRSRTCFTPAEIDLLQSVCEQMAIALERANLIASIQQQAQQLQQANRIKDEFLAVLSHELRSPLNPILGWSKLLQQRKLDAAKTATALATIERNAQLQSQLIEDLLDISRILRGKLSLNQMPVDLRMVVSSALETVRLAAEAKSLQIETTIPPNMGTVMGDAGRLQQVVWNLLSNAVKFTPHNGQIAVALTQTGTHAQIQVIDTGIGINPNFLPYVFEHFRQEDGATTRKFGGLGLGLAIARQIVEMHGGTITVESQGEGQGATFTVLIPLALQSSELPIEVSSDLTGDLSGIDILVVDDEPDSREFVAFVLEQAGAIVTSVASGIEALQAIEQSVPDLIVSDIGMPDLDGYMLMRQIRTLEQARHVPAIALTAYAGELDKQQAIAAGFGQHIPKPVEPEKLASAIHALCNDVFESKKQ